MRRISIGSWAYTIGPYADKPVDFETVCTKLRELGFDGVELGGFAPHPNPDDVAAGEARAQVVAQMAERGLAFSGLAANLWAEHLIDTDDPSKYIAEFEKNCKFSNDLGIKGIRVDTVQPPTIVDELGAVQGSPADIGGYFYPDAAKARAIMRPSDTFNATLATL